MRYINENNWYGGNIVSNEQYNKTLNDIEKTGKINIESIEDSLEHPKIIGNPHKTKALDIEINSISGITSDNVQEALDEIIGITNSTFRPIAEDISINPISGMTSDNTQEALNEIYNNTIRLETDLNGKITEINNTIDNWTGVLVRKGSYLYLTQLFTSSEAPIGTKIIIKKGGSVANPNALGFYKDGVRVAFVQTTELKTYYYTITIDYDYACPVFGNYSDVEILIETRDTIENAFDRIDAIELEVNSPQEKITPLSYNGFVNINGVLAYVSSSDYAHTEPIHLYEGDSLRMNASVVNTMAAFAYNIENGMYKNIQMGYSDGAVALYEFVAPFECDIVCSYRSDFGSMKNFYLLYKKSDLTSSSGRLLEKSKPLNGLTGVSFGDSITELWDLNYKTYSDYIRLITGANIINLGIGGTQIAQRTEYYSDLTSRADYYAYHRVDVLPTVKAIIAKNGSADFDKFNEGYMYLINKFTGVNKLRSQAVLERARATDLSTVDFVTIFAGTNDWTSGEKTATESYNALRECITSLLTAYPHLLVFYMCPIPRYVDNIRDESHWSDNYLNPKGITLKSFANTLLGIKDDVKIPVYDSYNLIGINQYNFSNYFNSTDGTHPAKGYMHLGRKFSAFLCSNYIV